MDGRNEWVLGQMLVPKPATVVAKGIPGIGDCVHIANHVVGANTYLCSLGKRVKPALRSMFYVQRMDVGVFGPHPFSAILLSTRPAVYYPVELQESLLVKG